MGPRVAVLQAARAGGVGREHPADGAGRLASRVRGETAADFGELRIQPLQHDARLHAHRVGSNFPNLAQMPAQVDDQPIAQRFAGDAGARPARDQRHLVFRAVAHDCLDVLGVERGDRAERLDLEDARIGTVEPAAKVIEHNLAAHDLPQIVANALTLGGIEGHRFTGFRGQGSGVRKSQF